MGTLGGGNGGERPSDGGNRRDGLPGLPPEWGTIVVPDDPAELAGEAAEVRRQLWRANRRDRWRARFRLPARAGPPDHALGLPLLIIAIAVIATLTSLFAIAWPKPQRQAFHPDQPSAIADVALVDANGTAVRLRDVVPAVVVLVEGCECAALLAQVAVAAGDGIAVLAVAPTVPSVAAPPGVVSGGRAPPGAASAPVRPLADPSDTVRARLRLPAPGGTASVALISRSGHVVRLVPRAHSIDEFRADLVALR